MIGDGENDVKAGQNAGCQTALIGNETYGQTVTVSSLKDFVEQCWTEEKDKFEKNKFKQPPEKSGGCFFMQI